MQLCDRSTPGSPELWSQHLSPSVAWGPQVLVMTESPGPIGQTTPWLRFRPVFFPSQASVLLLICQWSEAVVSKSLLSLTSRGFWLWEQSPHQCKCDRPQSCQDGLRWGLESTWYGELTRWDSNLFLPHLLPKSYFFAQGVRTENRLRIQPSNLQKRVFKICFKLLQWKT